MDHCSYATETRMNTENDFYLSFSVLLRGSAIAVRIIAKGVDPASDRAA